MKYGSKNLRRIVGILALFSVTAPLGAKDAKTVVLTVAVSAAKVIEDKSGFEEWLAVQPTNVAVVIIALSEKESADVAEYQDRVYVKLLGEDIGGEYESLLRALFDSYGDHGSFDSFTLGEPYKVEGYKAVIAAVASGV